MSSDDEGVKEIRCELDGKEYLVQDGIPYEIISKNGIFEGFDPKVKFITSSMKQWFNPEDYNQFDLPDHLQELVDKIMEKTNSSVEDTQNAPGENIFAKYEKKTCPTCKGTGSSGLKKACLACKGKGER